ncbi:MULTISPECIES: hypothetical protein [unclassified Beijerinckia]|uniref:hypothetical protein n=1 Tax=unclassified Beijerinckia TaxID=2638183 RepID=UPI0008967EE4|nr:MULTISPECIES: hypothetical protein [unclassified Beijerinckia]MDH7795463.1 hypothetical protein [Beijerinckia sp. GAS462]SEC02628.1 hypothetical protein SAMN05443249_1738 [Beijerinckia sp. 28-YEA-48]
MRRFARLLGLAKIGLALALPGAASAQAPRAYPPVPVTFDHSAATDPDLTALIVNLKQSVGNSDLTPLFAALSTNVAVITCPVDPLAPCAPGKRGVRQTPQSLSPIERLRQGLCCAGMAKNEITEDLRKETVTGLLAAALEAESIGAQPDVPGLACLPAWPIFDRTKAEAAVRATRIDKENLRVTTEEIVLRAKPAADAPEAARLSAGQIAPFMTDLDQPPPDGWYAIALPQGGIGYSDQVGLNELTPSGLCFAKETGGWKIALFVMRDQ